MTAINHAMTGALIGLVVGQPLVAIPAAFLSHFVCDMIPHFGLGDEFVSTENFRRYLVVDTLLCLSLVVMLAVLQPEHWMLASFAAFSAASPDLWSIRKFIRARQKKTYKPGRIKYFSQVIQWFEKPVGAVVEIAWAGACIYLLAGIV